MYNDFYQDYVYVIETRICLEKSYIDIDHHRYPFEGVSLWYPQMYNNFLPDTLCGGGDRDLGGAICSAFPPVDVRG